ncbi:MAG: hypothetical protein E7603_04280 [Ruminococcaceae bacterium]|nr:hypothetical protein [Oscillospiraceae bacterium]
MICYTDYSYKTANLSGKCGTSRLVRRVTKGWLMAKREDGFPSKRNQYLYRVRPCLKALRRRPSVRQKSRAVLEFLLPHRYGICFCYIYITMTKIPNVVSGSQS